MPIFRFILNGELTMENMGMLEMMVKARHTTQDQNMNDFLAEKYKLNDTEASKPDIIDKNNAEKQLKNYLEENKDEKKDE